MAVGILKTVSRAGFLLAVSMFFVCSACRRKPVSPSPGQKAAVEDRVEADAAHDQVFRNQCIEATRAQVKASHDYSATLQALKACEQRLSASFTKGRTDVAVDERLLDRARQADAEWLKLTALAKEQKAAKERQVAAARAMIRDRLLREIAARKRLGMAPRPGQPQKAAAQGIQR